MLEAQRVELLHAVADAKADEAAAAAAKNKAGLVSLGPPFLFSLRRTCPPAPAAPDSFALYVLSLRAFESLSSVCGRASVCFVRLLPFLKADRRWPNLRRPRRRQRLKRCLRRPMSTPLGGSCW